MVRPQRAAIYPNYSSAVPMTITIELTRDQLIEGLTNEWAFLIHDDFEEGDATEEEREEELKGMSHEQLMSELDRHDDGDIQAFLDLYVHNNK